MREELREYKYRSFRGYTITAMLTAEHAARLGAVLVKREPDVKQAPVPRNKARRTSNKKG